MPEAQNFQVEEELVLRDPHSDMPTTYQNSWKKSKCKFRIGALLLCTLLGLPGNIFILYFYYGSTPPPPPPPRLETVNLSLQCYEDYQEVDSYLQRSQFWIEGVLLISTGVIGLLGNLLSIVVLTRSMKKTAFNSYLKKLSAIDGAFLICCMLDYGYSSFTQDFPSWYSLLYPYLFHPLKSMFMTASIYMILAMAVDRHFAIRHPMKFRPSSDFSITVVGMMSVWYSIPKYFEFKVLWQDPDKILFWTTSLNEDSRYILFTSYMEVLVTGILPLSTLCLLNISIYLRIRQSATVETTTRPLRVKTEKSLGILVGIVMVFLLCQSLRLLIQLYEISSPMHGLIHHYEYCESLGKLHVPASVFVLGQFSHWFLVLNSSVNVFVYFYSSRSFQKGVVKLGTWMLTVIKFFHARTHTADTCQGLKEEEEEEEEEEGEEEETHL